MLTAAGGARCPSGLNGARSIRRREATLERAGNCCEGSPGYPLCRAENGQPHPVTGSTVVLTISHLDHDPANNEPANLRALCNRCHLAWDSNYHAENRRLRRLQWEKDHGNGQARLELDGIAPSGTAAGGTEPELEG
jgi:5-methylcytosine-specific restriction endonuclease McrA